MKKPIAELDPEQYQRLRSDWGAGLLPARTIAVKFGVHVEELRQHADDNGWEASDLNRAVPQAATRALIQRTVSDDDRANGLTAPRVVSSQDMVEQYGHIVARVTETQRSTLAHARGYVASLFDQLEALHGPQVDEAALKALAELIAKDNPQLAEALTKVNDPTPFMDRLKVLDMKATIVDKLTRALKQLIEVERVIWGMSDKAGEKATDYDTLLDRLNDLMRREPTRRIQ